MSGNVFICWSGERSKRLASELRELLIEVVPGLDKRVFISTQLEKGVRWFDVLMRELEQAQAGVVCLNAENLRSPWLHFEAGALAKRLNASPPGNTTKATANGSPEASHLFTYLHGVSADRLTGPLAAYQSSSATREDTWRLITSLTDAIGASNAARVELFDQAWPVFERHLKTITIDVHELIPEFETWFQRKTFEEPVRQCVDQTWIQRYDGARQTHDRVARELKAVKETCHRYQVDLYERLVSAIDGYAMAVRALLVRAEPFSLGASGELEISDGVVRACDDRREYITTLVTRILDPLAVAVIGDAATFWLTDSFEQKKMIVHRIEHALLVRRDRNSGNTSSESGTVGDERSKGLPSNGTAPAGPDAGLPPDLDASNLIGSSWDLDRIVGYLLIDHRSQSIAKGDEQQGGMEKALTLEAVRETERVESKTARVSLMPLHYALRALKNVMSRNDAANRADRLAIELLVADVEKLIEASRPAPDKDPLLDRRRHVRRTLREIGRLLSTDRGEPATVPEGPALRRENSSVGSE